MSCYCCGQPADRSCTRCGRFFCPRHGGSRLVEEGAGEGSHVVTRAVCDGCTPDQERLRYWDEDRRTVLALCLAVFVVVLILTISGVCGGCGRL